MRLVEFLIQLLGAQADTLKRLAALLGEENLFELLEMAGEEQDAAPLKTDSSETVSSIVRQLEPPRMGTSPGAAYQELEGAVRGFDLPEVLEFHLWAYPGYRAWIESAADLNARIPGPGGELGGRIVEEAMKQAEAWAKKLPVSPKVANQVERTAHVPWLRFRTDVLKRIGKRPLGPVY